MNVAINIYLRDFRWSDKIWAGNLWNLYLILLFDCLISVKSSKHSKSSNFKQTITFCTRFSFVSFKNLSNFPPQRLLFPSQNPSKISFANDSVPVKQKASAQELHKRNENSRNFNFTHVKKAIKVKRNSKAFFFMLTNNSINIRLGVRKRKKNRAGDLIEYFVAKFRKR